MKILNSRDMSEIQGDYDQKFAAMTKLINSAKEAGRDLSPDEVTKFDSLDCEIRALAAEKSKVEKHVAAVADINARIADGSIDVPDYLKGGASGSRPGSMKSAAGKQMVVAVGPNQKLSRSPVASGQIGEFARAIAIGLNNPFATPEVKAALTSDLNSSGGYSVPTTWLSGWIDRGVELTSVAQYCTRLMMDAASVNITTLTSRPTASTKAELAKFGESGMTFGSSRLEAFTAGSSFLTSLELLADSPNAAQQIELACLRGLIDWLNNTMLNGTGSAEPTGILNRGGLPGEPTTGVLTWDAIADGVSALREELYVPNALIVSPAVYNLLHLQRELDAGDGAYLPRPEHLQSLNIVESSHCPDTKAILADFTQLMLGVREDAKVEVSPVADEAFERNAVRIRLKIRCDWVPAHNQAFYLFDGITLA